MSKLDGLKEKIAQLKATIVAKLENIPVLKKFFEKKPDSSPAAVKNSALNLSTIYREGGVLTRLQVILLYFLMIATFASAGLMVKRSISNLKSMGESDKLKKEYAQGFENLKHKMEEKAEIISIGTMTVNAFVGEDKKAMVNIDIWAKVSDPATAGYADKHDLIFHDKTLEVLNELFTQKVNLLTEQGKEIAKKKIKEALNKSIEHGKVEEIFFHNLVVQ